MKAYILSLGCARNLVDSEVLAGALRDKRVEIADSAASCDVAIVNTCSFIREAQDESIETILELAELKKKGKIRRLIVTGCLPQRYAGGLKDEIREIDAVFGSSDFIKIPRLLGAILRGKTMSIVTARPRYLYDERSPRQLFTPPHYAYIKIQEGCRNNCSYCVIPRLRGPYRSRSMESVVKEIRSIGRKGRVSEINLIGEDTTLFGIDRYKKPSLARLLKRIAPLMKNGWIRVLYTHPAHYSDELIDLVSAEDAIVKYLDLPIQHINDRILKKMNRRITKRETAALIEKLRKRIPGLALRTSVMVGFPGETDKEFSELLSFLREIRFERLGCFTYSREDDTPAALLPRQVPENIKRSRFDEIMKTQREISEENNRRYLGKDLKCLIDEAGASGKGQFIARPQMDAPEVDGCVYARSERDLKPGDFINVKITGTLEYDLIGHDTQQ